LKDDPAATKYAKIAGQIKTGINTHLWIPEKGYYGQYLYGRHFKILSPRAEALGEALTILFDIADSERQKTVVAQTPVTNFGIPCIYPQIPDIPPYHNDAIWPFVQSYWTLAAAKTGNAEAVVESLSSIYRPAALFLTNKENFVSSSGDFAGTQVNSSNMLWSLSGNISLIYKVIFGMETQENALIFKPFVPEVLGGERRLTNFKYRKAVLDISLSGYGNIIKSIMLDGNPLPLAKIPSDLSGPHCIVIVMANNELENSTTGLVNDYFSVAAPAAKITDGLLKWNKVEGAIKYLVLLNGKEIASQTGLSYPTITDGEYQVIAMDKKEVLSFASEPLLRMDKQQPLIFFIDQVAEKSALPYLGCAGTGFAEISRTVNKRISIAVTIPETGTYAVDFRYANGNGPTNTENKCAIRTLTVDGSIAGTFVFPQRGKDEWSAWGFSNTNVVPLSKGVHQFTLTFEDWNENMNGAVNQAMLDYLRVIRLK